MRSRLAHALAAGAIGIGSVIVPAGVAVAAPEVGVAAETTPVSETDEQPERQPPGRDLGRLATFTLVGGLIAGVAAFALSRRQDNDD